MKIIKLKTVIVTYVLLFMLTGCGETKPITDENSAIIEPSKQINLVWTLFDQDSYYKDYYHKIKFNMSLKKDSLAISIYSSGYSLTYLTPLQETDWRKISDIISGQSRFGNLYSEEYKSNCLVRLGEDLVKDTMATQLIDMAISLSPFLPEIDTFATKPIPKINPSYCRLDTTHWKKLSIREEQWSPIFNDIYYDGRAMFYDYRTKNIPKKHDEQNQVKVNLNSYEMDSLNHILFRCNPRGYFCYIDSVALDLDTITFELDGRTFFKCYAWPTDIPGIYDSLKNFGYHYLSTQ